MKYAGRNLENPVLCTCRLARRLLPELYSKRLGVVSRHLGIRNIKAHRARGDALATTQVLDRFLSMLEEKGIKEHDEIIRFQTTKLPKVKWESSAKLYK
jgi:DNA polymerase-3 subunit epsilon